MHSHRLFGLGSRLLLGLLLLLRLGLGFLGVGRVDDLDLLTDVEFSLDGDRVSILFVDVAVVAVGVATEAVWLDVSGELR